VQLISLDSAWKFFQESYDTYKVSSRTFLCYMELRLCLYAYPRDIVWYLELLFRSYFSKCENGNSTCSPIGDNGITRKKKKEAACELVPPHGSGVPFGFNFVSRRVEFSAPRTQVNFFIAIDRPDDGSMRCRISSNIPSARWSLPPDLSLALPIPDVVVGLFPRKVRGNYVPLLDSSKWTVFRVMWIDSPLPRYATVFDDDKIYGVVALSEHSSKFRGKSDVVYCDEVPNPLGYKDWVVKSSYGIKLPCYDPWGGCVRIIG
jgi:hypothetical protein